MFLWLKRLSGSMSDGQWFSGRPEVTDLSLERDWRDIERVLAEEGLDLGRDDLAGWLSVPGAVGLIARKAGEFAGCFIGHPVGNVARVDLVCVSPGYRKASIARPLYFRGVNQLKVGGAVGFVAHASGHVGALLELLNYAPGLEFVEYHSEVGEMTVAGGHRGELVDEHEMTVDEVVALDAAAFGTSRAAWLQHLFYRSDTEIYGYRKKGELIACLCLQRVGGDVLRVRLAHGREFVDLSSLLHVVMVMNSGKRLRCQARRGSRLATMFESLDFETLPGSEPVTEYRLGQTAGIGDGPGIYQLSWG